ncbi:MAG: DNA mismatch repair protein MutS, partial [Planctomycetota bacterium]
MTTPMMQQWKDAKSAHGDGILFFRMGDFYEFFHEDAKRAAELLGLTLTARSKGPDSIPMAGIPVKAADAYVRRLVARGEKVVICEQVEDPAEAKGIVQREITRIVTPGTITEF